MQDFFSRGWLESFAQRWNANTEMVEPLAAAGFDAIIALGFADEKNPSVILEIKQGKVEKAGIFSPNSPDATWDMRATQAGWDKWKQNGLGISGLGVAVATGQLQFRAGDYRRMIRNPQLAMPFLKFFSIL
ncbi:MAG: hypothetical protein Q8O37_13570 [Sulfuricellaceae bacterium]|nr:hypothetical protein [Sulfuricellaceae bacterium]